MASCAENENKDFSSFFSFPLVGELCDNSRVLEYSTGSQLQVPYLVAQGGQSNQVRCSSRVSFKAHVRLGHPVPATPRLKGLGSLLHAAPCREMLTTGMIGILAVGDKLPSLIISAGTNGIMDNHSRWQCLFQTEWGIDNLRVGMSWRGRRNRGRGSEGGLHDGGLASYGRLIFLGFNALEGRDGKVCLGFSKLYIIHLP